MTDVTPEGTAQDQHDRTDQQDRSDQQLSEYWRGLVTGDHRMFNLMSRGFRRLPGSPRCKVCRAPLGGPASAMLRVAGLGRPSKMNPRFCNTCDVAAAKHPGGAEVELSMLFADVRGSTRLAEHMAPAEFRGLMNRFYAAANAVLIETDALIDKMVGDEVVALYLPMIGPDHAHHAVDAGLRLLEATGHADGAPWLPVGVGVHTGLAFVGTVGSGDTVTDFTAMGDAVNVTARLASVAGAGEVLVSDAAARAAELPLDGHERRTLHLKGRTEPLHVTVLRATVTTSA